MLMMISLKNINAKISNKLNNSTLSTKKINKKNKQKEKILKYQQLINKRLPIELVIVKKS